MVLALELAHQGLSVTLLEQNRSTTPYPKMEVINGRTLELLRRLQDGEIVNAIRAHGNSEEDRFVKNFCSPNGKHVLASWTWPSVNEQKTRNMARNDGTAPLEPYCRLSQYIMEPLLMKFCKAAPLINLCIGQRFLSFQETADGVVSMFEDLDTGAKVSVVFFAESLHRSPILPSCATVGDDKLLPGGLRGCPERRPTAAWHRHDGPWSPSP
jgi:2-polyprenyl-6-methoxyphenol hydroxylase-like FAD-dependent oxidoreductase